jgi:catalase
VHSVVWDEAQKISGQDPDFLRRDLWDAIENGDFPAWELGVQLVEEEDEHKFAFDLLDPTKIIPEELVPVRRVGKLTLNRNPANFFAETEQVAFHPGHLVPGIDFTNDPLLQGRLFSYTDTQLLRLGGANFHEIPINRPVADVHNHQRDGHMRQTINQGQVSYEPNSLGGGCPMQAGRDMGGFISFAQKLSGDKVRARSEKFFDHFSQAALFFRSQSAPEQEHMVQALRFELGKVNRPEVRSRMVGILAFVDQDLAAQVARGLGIEVPRLEPPLNRSVPADGKQADFEPRPARKTYAPSPALSMLKKPVLGIKTRKVAFLAGDGFDDASFAAVKKALVSAGAQVKVVAPRLGFLKSAKGAQVKIDFSLLTAGSVLFDAVFVPGGENSAAQLGREAKTDPFLADAYKHGKALAATGAAAPLLRSVLSKAATTAARDPQGAREQGIATGQDNDAAKVARDFIQAMSQHRAWDRELACSKSKNV